MELSETLKLPEYLIENSGQHIGWSGCTEKIERRMRIVDKERQNMDTAAVFTICNYVNHGSWGNLEPRTPALTAAR